MTYFRLAGGASILLWLDQLPIIHNQEATLTLDATALHTSLDMDDPWLWSVDRVVQELCTTQRMWTPRATLKDLPAAAATALEQKLREEGVDGCMLLADVTDAVMKDVLGLQKFAWRVFVTGAIETLSKQSTRYQQYKLENRMDSYISSHHTATLVGTGYPQQIQIPPTPPARQQSPLIVGTVLSKPLDPGLVINARTDSRAARGEFVISDESGNKRRKLDLTNTASNLALQSEDEDNIFREIPELEEELLQADSGIPTPTPEPMEPNGKKRKRIAPTLLSSKIDPNRNRDIATAADTVIHNDPQKIEPGVLFRDEDGRKRLVPIYQPDGDSDEVYDYQGLLQHSTGDDVAALDQGFEIDPNAAPTFPKKVNRKLPLVSAKPDTGYLGKKKLSVDDIFYGETPVGQELSPSEDPQEFSVPWKEIASGRRLSVHRIMKRYLHSERAVLVRDGKIFSAVRPYSVNLVPRHLKPSFTLYYASEDGQIQARREELRSWPEIDPEAVLQKAVTDYGGNEVTFNVTKPGFLDLVSSVNDPLDPDLLEKYNYIDGGDEVLPLYGESDEENEYDIQTWKEIEEEQGALEKPIKPSARPRISRDEVFEAIDEVTNGLVEKWRKQKLPNKTYKAFKLWKKYREKRRLKNEQLEQRQFRLDHVNKRIMKLRQEIAANHWISQDQVRKQSRMLEPSIFDREDCTWEIRLLKSNDPPERLPTRQSTSEAPSKKSTVPTDDGEEGESIENETDASVSDGDLDDFILDDSPLAEDEKELDLTDAENEEDASISEFGLPDLSRNPPTARKLIFKRLPTRSPRRSVEDDEPMPAADRGPFLSNCSDRGSPIKDEPNLPKLPASAAAPNNGTEMIDLTMMSSDDGPHSINLVTPRKRKTPILKLTNRNSPFKISDSEDAQIPDQNNLPPLKETNVIARFGHRAWINLKDRERLLITVLRGMLPKMRHSMFSLTADTELQLWASLVEVMDYIRNKKAGVKGMDDQTAENLCVLIQLFAMFHYCKYYPYREKPRRAQVTGLRYEQASHSEFYAFLRKIQIHFEDQTSPFSAQQQRQYDDEDEEPQPAIRRRSISRAVNSPDDEDIEQDTPHKTKRKKKVFEDVHARSLRERDRERLAAQQERRQKLQASQAEMADQVGDGGDIIINESKLEKHGFVYVNPKIARRIKKHQIEGVRFMWNQVVTVENADEDADEEADESLLSGCLLAHTMGLGKTMQVITLLVAIAEASSSTNKSIFGQIPFSLRASKTLILCPPGLIDNWMDELLIWAPEGVLGELRKVDASTHPRNRLGTIDDWCRDGGVLVMGYEMYRILINNTKRKGAETATLDAENHAQVKNQLTVGPNLIIADEAHKLKNATSAITVAASQFRSRSRIALTGSPLANNVEEYHSMIEWIAPNYLGPAVEFRAKYVEPIQEGLYYDSTPAERRKSMIMLGVLKDDISPKVDRADMSVLRNDLPPKKEFVITVPLTDLQSKAYTIYVKSMMANAIRNKDGDIAQTTLWHWLAILSLLCNHPDCFMSKLTERREDAKKGAKSNTPISREVTDQEDIGVDLNTSYWKIGVSESLVKDEQRLFLDEAADLKSIDLSNKTRILCQILDASKAAGDKTLVFSQSIPTLDFLERMCKTQNRVYARLDGSTPMAQRQIRTKQFNTGSTDIYLISTTAGGLGLNLWGANRVVIFDFKFNPILEEQAIGRAYRIGQKKDVFVYRFVAGGTFEDSVHNKAIFKKQLASRVVDKRKPLSLAKKKLGEFLHEPKEVEQKDLSEIKGMDREVLDKILASEGSTGIRAIVQTDTFEKDDNEDLTIEEQKQVKQMVNDEQLKRSDPKAYLMLMTQRQKAEQANAFRASLQAPRPNPDSTVGMNNSSAGFPPQRSASSTILPSQILSLSPPARANNLPISEGLMNSLNRPPTMPSFNSAKTESTQRSSSGPISTPSRPNHSLSGLRTSSPPQDPTPNPNLQPLLRLAVPRLSKVAPRITLSPILGASTVSRPGSDSPETIPPQVAPAIRSDKIINKSADRSSNGGKSSGGHPRTQKLSSRDVDGVGGDDKDKPLMESEMMRAMSRGPSRPSVRPLRDPVTKSHRQKLKTSNHHSDEGPPAMQRVLEKRHKSSRSVSTTQPPSSRSSATSASSTNGAIPASTSPSKGEARLPHWAMDNVRGANSRNGKRHSPVILRTEARKD